MISFEEAYRTIIESARLLDSERVGMACALNRVLAEDVCSDVDMPPFNKSAMDGYACKREDLSAELRVLETVKAGCAPSVPIGKGECTKVMTGAPVPDGADCVIKVEDTQTCGDDLVRFVAESTKDNICLKAEDVMIGDCVLKQGVLLRPQEIAVLAGVGCTDPQVRRKAKVGIIATGDELVNAEERPSSAQIRSTNNYQLCAQVESVGAQAINFGIAGDTREDLENSLRKASDKCGVVIMSGGVSKGDYDFVPEIMQTCGFEILFDSVAMKPGRPFTYGVADGKYCVGLPGNPATTFIQFELLLRPFLYKLMGLDHNPPVFKAHLDSALSVRKSSVPSWIPVRFTDDNRVVPCEYHGSAHIAAMCAADALLMIPAGAETFDEGDFVDVRPL